MSGPLVYITTQNPPQLQSAVAGYHLYRSHYEIQW